MYFIRIQAFFFYFIILLFFLYYYFYHFFFLFYYFLSLFFFFFYLFQIYFNSLNYRYISVFLIMGYLPIRRCLSIYLHIKFSDEVSYTYSIYPRSAYSAYSLY